MFLLLGDYGTAFPWINKVVEIIRNLISFVVVRGNHEDYMPTLLTKSERNSSPFA